MYFSFCSQLNYENTQCCVDDLLRLLPQPRPWSLWGRGCAVLALLSFHRTFTISVEDFAIFTLDNWVWGDLWWFRQRHHLLYSAFSMKNGNCFFQGLCSLQVYCKHWCLWYPLTLVHDKMQIKKTKLPPFIYPHKKQMIKIGVPPFKETV